MIFIVVVAGGIGGRGNQRAFGLEHVQIQTYGIGDGYVREVYDVGFRGFRSFVISIVVWFFLLLLC